MAYSNIFEHGGQQRPSDEGYDLPAQSSPPSLPPPPGSPSRNPNMKLPSINSFGSMSPSHEHHHPHPGSDDLIAGMPHSHRRSPQPGPSLPSMHAPFYQTPTGAREMPPPPPGSAGAGGRPRSPNDPWASAYPMGPPILPPTSSYPQYNAYGYPAPQPGYPYGNAGGEGSANQMYAGPSGLPTTVWSQSMPNMYDPRLYGAPLHSAPAIGRPNVIGSGEERDVRSKRQYRKKTPPAACAACGATDTPEWRKGPSGSRTLCNACGLQAQKLFSRAPENADEITEQLRILGEARKLRLKQQQAGGTIGAGSRGGSVGSPSLAQDASPPPMPPMPLHPHYGHPTGYAHYGPPMPTHMGYMGLPPPHLQQGPTFPGPPPPPLSMMLPTTTTAAAPATETSAPTATASNAGSPTVSQQSSNASTGATTAATTASGDAAERTPQDTDAARTLSALATPPYPSNHALPAVAAAGQSAASGSTTHSRQSSAATTAGSFPTSKAGPAPSPYRAADESNGRAAEAVKTPTKGRKRERESSSGNSVERHGTTTHYASHARHKSFG